MQLRAPAVPLITIDPYFSVWSPANRLIDADTVHWTGHANLLRGRVEIDGQAFRFLGRGAEPALEQVAIDVGTFSSTYTFEGAGVRLVASFTTPLLPGNLDLLSRPVSFLELRVESLDGDFHAVRAVLEASEQFVMNQAGDSPVETETLEIGGLRAVRLAAREQKVLARSGDDLRVEWGSFYLAAAGAETGTRVETDVTYQDGNLREHDRPTERTHDLSFGTLSIPLTDKPALVLFAFDDMGQSLEVFGHRLSSWWNRSGKTIVEAMTEAAADYAQTRKACDAFDERLEIDATRAGGEKYADLVRLAFRQSVSAHKVAVDPDGNVLFVSKENFSNGCAATVDVTYPSAPLFLLYNPELLRGMLRPIYTFAASKAWPYDFAPHDAGQYPLVNGQVYGRDEKTGEQRMRDQMPVEECGNMLILEAALALAEDNASFAESHLDTLRAWVRYLERYGEDPEDQLCTDDFAGHLAHNCNLALKAILGISAFGILLTMLGKADEAVPFLDRAREMANSWRERAANADGSFRLAFDRPDSFSLKYNAVWDLESLFGTELFPGGTFASDLARWERESLPFGVPLDSRKAYTKSDWLVWAAALAPDRAAFERLVAPLWLFFHTTPDRVPMTDWYWADTAQQRGFQARSVQGGLFLKLLADRGLRPC